MHAFSHEHARSAVAKVLKVKAHEDLDGLPEGFEATLARGNHAADGEAKHARRLHPQPPSLEARLADRSADRAVEVCKHLARSSARWPAAASGERLAARPEHAAALAAARAGRRAQAAARRQQKQLQQAQAVASHDWAQWRSRTRCRKCWKVRREGVMSVCEGSHTRLRSTCRQAQELGHRFCLADFGAGRDANGIMAACLRCGAWSVSGRSSKLSQRCRAPTAAGQTAIGRIRQGRFPIGDSRYRGVALSDVMPLCPQALE